MFCKHSAAIVLYTCGIISASRWNVCTNCPFLCSTGERVNWRICEVGSDSERLIVTEMLKWPSFSQTLSQLTSIVGSLVTASFTKRI